MSCGDEDSRRVQGDTGAEDDPANIDIEDEDERTTRSKPRHKRLRKYRRCNKYIAIPRPESSSTCYSSTDDRYPYTDGAINDDDGDVAKTHTHAGEYGVRESNTKSFEQHSNKNIKPANNRVSEENLETVSASSVASTEERMSPVSSNGTNPEHNRRVGVKNDEGSDSVGSDSNAPSYSYMEGHRSSSEDSVFGVRAKSARDLVMSQERLVEMLQAMKTDISRMDREATRIREDVVRSNQLFDITVRKKDAHHLSMTRDGYNMFYSMPKVTYKTHSYNDGPGTMRFLSQLSSFRNERLSSDSSRRSSVTSAYHVARSLRAEHRRSIRESLASVAMSRNSSSSSLARFDDGNYSGTESDMESTCSSRTSWSRASPMAGDTDVTYEGAGSSTESASTYRAASPREYMGEKYANRRSSYFYTARVPTPQQALSDEVEL